MARAPSAAKHTLRAALFVVGVLTVAIVMRAFSFLADAGAIGAGYAAKQLCSGVFVAQLPARFVMDTDVLPRLATVGPMPMFLDYDIDMTARHVSASMLGQSMIAQFRPNFGCTLTDDGTLERYSPMQQADTLSQYDASALPTSKIGEPETTEEHQSVFLSAGVTSPLTAVINDAFAEPAHGGRNTLAVIVMHRGELVAERYQAPVAATNPMQGWSMNKSLMATFIGYQIDAGQLSLDDSVREMLQREGFSEKKLNQIAPNLSLEHLLSMSSGFDFSERYLPGDDVTAMLYQHEAMGYSAPLTGHINEPGKEFAYSSGDINTAAMMWQQSLGSEPYTDWVAHNFIAPLGLHKMVLEPDASGVQVGSSYAYLTARDWALMGQLWLDAWHGRSALISQAWQRKAVKPGTANNGEIYGLGFWLNTGQRRFPNAPESTFHAGGNSGQFVVVMPEQELVIVRLGLTLDESQAKMDQLLKAVLSIF